MTRLTTELARLEEDNGRQRWMIGEKDKQIKETQAKFAASEAYALRERLQGARRRCKSLPTYRRSSCSTWKTTR